MTACGDVALQRAAPENKVLYADVLSVVGMVASEPGARDCLKYKLIGNRTELGVWGHEYVRHLAGEISEVHAASHRFALRLWGGRVIALQCVRTTPWR